MNVPMILRSDLVRLNSELHKTQDWMTYIQGQNSFHETSKRITKKIK